uniref:Probable cyclin-dependent serine/threonine-protein kinase DDB_G0292550 n=1 Tax=Dermatophagoides pteronyssinus TaxID=6956 RepID=A0A6P6YCH1_DERPT|nr:probable cyclin-dependent serine/threonine-protein kinase DDB_G0292550 [Dermatophagoides pteronyssinus]
MDHPNFKTTTNKSSSPLSSSTTLCWCCLKSNQHNGNNNGGNRINSSNKERISNELIKSFSFDNDDDIDADLDDDDNLSEYCYDEDEDLMKQQTLSKTPPPPLLPPPTTITTSTSIPSCTTKISDDYYYISKLNECLNETNQWYRQQQQQQLSLQHRSNIIDHHHNHQYLSLENDSLIPRTGTNKLTKIQRQNSICLNDEHMMNTNTNMTTAINNDNFNKNRSRNILKQQAIYASIALKNNTKTFNEMFLSDNDNNNKDNRKKTTSIINHNHNHNNDLISLAEKGRIGKQISTDGSLSSETGSTNEDAIIILTQNNHHTKRNILKCLKNVESNETADSSIIIKDNNKYQTLNNNYYNDNNYESDTQSSNLPDFSPTNPQQPTLSEQNISTTKATTKMMIKSGSSIGVIGGGSKNGGRLEISFAYNVSSKKLFVTVIQGDEIPYKDQHKNVLQIYVKIILLPNKKQKFRTKSKPIFCPIFDETFTFNRISPDDISNLGLRFRLFSIGFTRKTYLIGESRISFALIKPQQQETKLWFTLDVPAKRNRLLDLESSSLTRTDSTSSQSLQNNSSPELLLSLAYNGTTGRLNVTMIKGSQFRCLSTRTPDTYIKLLLVSQNGNEMARGKTRICRGQPNPLFRETFVFQVALFQLPDVTLMIFVYNKRSIKRKEMIGWISLGYNSSGDEELSHWNDMRDNKGEQVSRWHVLHEP